MGGDGSNNTPPNRQQERRPTASLRIVAGGGEGDEIEITRETVSLRCKRHLALPFGPSDFWSCVQAAHSQKDGSAEAEQLESAMYEAQPRG
jgi:hypothetical protein